MTVNASHTTRTTDDRDVHRGLNKHIILIFAIALVIRTVYLFELSTTPGFDYPIIDSATYTDIARNIASNGVLDPRLFWQGFFYPLFLSGIFAITGASLTGARIFQVILGSVTCVMVFRTAGLFLDRRAALAAGLGAALFGPLIFFEVELLASGWAAFWMISLLYVTIRCGRDWGLWGFLATGIIGGLAAATRPTFIPAMIASMIVLTWQLRSRRDRGRRNLYKVSAMAGGFLAVILVVSILSHTTSGYFSPVPRSGSLNMYIGNNPDTDATMMIRPGAEWKKLVREPELHGYIDDSGYREYFMNRFKVYVATQPGSFIRGLTGKSVQFLSSREMPRNVDVYSSRLESRLMRILVWKYGGFGFPFGLLLPLVVLGFVFAPKTRDIQIWILPLIYSLSLILVFISSRYRTALIPVLLIVGAAGAFAAVDRIRHGNRIQRWTVFVIVIGSVFISIFPGPFVVENFDYTAEKYASIGYEMGKAGKLEDALEVTRKSLEINPEYAAGHRMLGNLLNQAGRPDEAAQHLRMALREEPDSYMTHFYLALALVRQGISDEAILHLTKAREGASQARDRDSLHQIERFSAMMTRDRDEE